jgi:hypothetical protein
MFRKECQPVQPTNRSKDSVAALRFVSTPSSTPEFVVVVLVMLLCFVLAFGLLAQ